MKYCLVLGGNMNIFKIGNKILLIYATMVLVGMGNISFAMDTIRGIQSFVSKSVDRSNLLDLFTVKQNSEFWKRGLFAGLRYTGAATSGVVAYTQLKLGNYKIAGVVLLCALSCLSFGDLKVEKIFKIPSYTRDAGFGNITDTVLKNKAEDEDIEMGYEEFKTIYHSTIYSNIKRLEKINLYNYWDHNCMSISSRLLFWAFQKNKVIQSSSGTCNLEAKKVYKENGISDLYKISEESIIRFCEKNPGKDYCNYDFLRRYILGYNFYLRDEESKGNVKKFNTTRILQEKSVPIHFLEELPFEIWCHICFFIPKKIPKITPLPIIDNSYTINELTQCNNNTNVDREKVIDIVVENMRKKKGIQRINQKIKKINQKNARIKRTGKALRLWLKEKRIVISKQQFIHMLKYCFFREGSENAEIYNPENILMPLSIKNIAPAIGTISKEVKASTNKSSSC